MKTCTCGCDQNKCKKPECTPGLDSPRCEDDKWLTCTGNGCEWDVEDCTANGGFCDGSSGCETCDDYNGCSGTLEYGGERCSGDDYTVSVTITNTTEHNCTREYKLEFYDHWNDPIQTKGWYSIKGGKKLSVTLYARASSGEGYDEVKDGYTIKLICRTPKHSTFGLKTISRRPYCTP